LPMWPAFGRFYELRWVLAELVLMRGLRVRRVGKREKSRSAVRSSRTPWLRQRAAIRASWMRGPTIWAAETSERKWGQ
jgi:hypothetical protein